MTALIGTSKPIRKFEPLESIRRLTLSGGFISAALVFGLGGWAIATEIAGAVIAPGRIIVESSVKKVQHPTGGVVGELRVREGQHVKAGEILLRLDQTQTLAGLDIIRQGIDELSARKARDEAERDGLAAVAFPAELLDRRGDPRVAHLIADEETLFKTRREGRDGQKAQFNEQIGQLAEQSSGTVAEIDAKTTEIYWSKEELKGIQDLWRRKLVEFTRLTALQRESARLEGERGRLASELAEIRSKTAEIKLKILQIDEDSRTEVGKELAEIRGKLSELREKQISAEDQLKRIDLRAPQDGFVHQLTIHTVGGVITASEPVMLIVPDGEALTIEARIDPNEINQVHLGQPVVVRFPGLGQRTTPEIDGEVTLVSADLTQDEKSGASYYMIRVSLPDEQVSRLGIGKLVPGMPVETFIETPARTVLSFLVKPMRDQIEKAFRER
jgi:HlyD family secretion protein